MNRRPPMLAAGSRKPGMLPRITTSRAGNATEKKIVSGSRQSSFSSFRVSFINPFMSRAPFGFGGQLRLVAGQGDEGVIEARLLDPKVGGDDLVAGEDGDHAVEQVAGARDDDLGAVPGDLADLRQRRQQPVVELCADPEPN